MTKEPIWTHFDRRVDDRNILNLEKNPDKKRAWIGKDLNNYIKVFYTHKVCLGKSSA